MEPSGAPHPERVTTASTPSARRIERIDLSTGTLGVAGALASTPTDELADTQASNWTIKNVPLATRLAALGAARRAGQPMWQWLSWAVETATAQQGRNSVIPPEGTTNQFPVQSAPQLALSAPTTPSLEDIARALDLAVQIAALRGRTLSPRARVLVLANRLLVQRLSPP